MHRFLLAPFAVTILAVGGIAQDKKEIPDPTPRKPEILKLFADEFRPLTPGTGKFPASFTMGSDRSAAEKPPRQVAFGSSFAMGKNEVTQELYWVVMGANPSKWKGPRNAVEVVSWQEANDFCAQATKVLRDAKLISAKERIRLPSEAEWEYACRAGTTTAWAHGDDLEGLGVYCWYKANSKGHDPPVGAKKANPWGLYDMHGYNWEWVADAWAPDYKDAPTDGSPRELAGAKDRVLRGGSWADPADAARSSARHHLPATTRHDTIGFRCVKAAE